jgi:hypothetical protein
MVMGLEDGRELGLQKGYEIGMCRYLQRKVEQTIRESYTCKIYGSSALSNLANECRDRGWVLRWMCAHMATTAGLWPE